MEMLYLTVLRFFDLAMRGKLDRIFFSGAQKDKYGNLNNTLIGSPSNIKIKLPVQTSWNYIRNTSLCRALTGEKVNLLPAVRPDWAIIHAHLSDPKGNVKLHPPYFADLLAIEASRNSIISHASGHLAYVNSGVPEISGIDSSTPQPEGGRIVKDSDGNPTGLLEEDPAINRVLSHIPPYPPEKLKGVMRKGIEYFHKYGITSIHDAAIGYFRNEKPIIQVYCDFEREGSLTIRVYLTLVERVYRKIMEAGFKTGFGSDFLKLGAVKFFQDGSIQALTAALEEPYFCKPEHRGELIYDQGELNRLIEYYHRQGIQVAVHANGDRTIGSVLEAFKRAIENFPRTDSRHMIIHCQLATRDQIEEMKKLGIIPSYFVNHVHYWATGIWRSFWVLKELPE
ncbi:MAG: hypothetical protein DRG59_09675 [Deltaproteobacteria bacterium]|nr:MAG: hypothetical protein DRG83_03865 [Deltaproteobacteria bacterium]RLB04904.1 MAG: hypothetical protein DRG59_09675 [Deltaproteobacteria bacterium]